MELSILLHPFLLWKKTFAKAVDLKAKAKGG